MFKKLKREFVLVNMLMISAVMLLAFAAIYLITYRNIQNQNQLRIENIAVANLTYMAADQNTFMVSAMASTMGDLEAFSVIVDEDGSFSFDGQLSAATKDQVHRAVQEALAQAQQQGKIWVEDKQFQFTITQFSAAVVVNESQPETPAIQTRNQITFLDVTQSRQTLQQMLLTLVSIGLGTLAAMLGISLFFARQAVVPIEQSYNQQQQFIQDASHELKTPLASIGANLDAIAASPQETVQDQKKWLHFISLEVDRMTKLVNDMLSLAKSEHLASAADLAPVDCSALLENAVASVEAVLLEKGVDFQQSIQPDLWASGDGEKLEQVVKILLDNAVKYTQPQGTIRVDLYQSKHQVVLAVSNTGPGIGPEHLDHIFDRFYRVDAARKHDGSYGLGLAIAKSLVEGMQGKISVESSSGKETVFTVILNSI